MTETQEIEAELAELNKVKFIKPTAAQLHQRRHALVSRVQRKEDRRYWKNVQAKKAELSQRLLDLKTVPPGTLLPIQAKVPPRVKTRIESKRRLKPTR